MIKRYKVYTTLRQTCSTHFTNNECADNACVGCKPFSVWQAIRYAWFHD